MPPAKITPRHGLPAHSTSDLTIVSTRASLSSTTVADTLPPYDDEKKGDRSASSAPPHGDDHDDEYPDGGLRAWLVVLGATCNLFSTFGLINTWGAFQAYYELNILKESTASNITPSCFFPGCYPGACWTVGHYRAPLHVASVVLVAMVFLLGQCWTYWQFVLCQGVVTGLASGVIYGPTFAVVSQWFRRRRATALGLAAVGTSIGGTVLPIAFERMVIKIGFSWTMRALGFLLLFTLGFSNLTMRTRLPPSPPKSGIFQFSALKSAPFAVYSASALLTFLGSPIVLTYLESSALSAGVSPSIPLLSIANASSVVGRVASGMLADRLGAISVMAPFTAAAGLLTYAWAFAPGPAYFVAVAVLFGIACGAYVSLSVIPIMSFGDKEDVGRRIGVFQTIMAAGALGAAPIAGAINQKTGGYGAVGLYAGTMILLSVVLMLLTRHLVLRRVWGKF